MNQEVNQTGRRAGSVSRTIRLLLTIAALTGVGLSLGACSECLPDGNGGFECYEIPSHL